MSIHQAVFPGDMTGEAKAALRAADAAIVGVIERMYETGVPPGLIVAILHAHAMQQTARMLDDSDD